jgi:hypothetical protein
MQTQEVVMSYPTSSIAGCMLANDIESQQAERGCAAHQCRALLSSTYYAISSSDSEDEIDVTFNYQTKIPFRLYQEFLHSSSPEERRFLLRRCKENHQIPRKITIVPNSRIPPHLSGEQVGVLMRIRTFLGMLFTSCIGP